MVVRTALPLRGMPDPASMFAHSQSFNLDGGFFVFGDLSIKVEGEYRLEFTLYEQRR
jgi:hypothetical protein